MRARLMGAARKLFTEVGYEATTLQQIVKEAQTSIGNYYFYFPNKEEILLAIAEEYRAELAAKIDAAIAPLPLGPGLLAVAFYAGVLAALEQPEIAQFTLLGTAHPSLRPMAVELFSNRVENAFRRMPNLFSDWPDATPQLAAAAWHGAGNIVLDAVLSGRIYADREQVARFLVRWNLQALGLPADVVQQAMAALPSDREAQQPLPLQEPVSE